MNRKHFLFAKFQIKSTLGIIPRLLLFTLLFSIIVLSIGFVGTKVFDKKSAGIVNIDVAVVLPDGDKEVELCFLLLSSMDSISSTCNFILTNEDEGKKMLLDGKVCAIFKLPPDFVKNLKDGVNTPATVTLPANAGLESIFFKSLIDSGAHTLSNSESGIYAVGDLYEKYGFEWYDTPGNQELYDFYYKYALNRSDFFVGETVSDTGITSLQSFYLCSGILLLMMLCLMTVCNQFANRPRAVSESLKIHKLSLPYIRFCEVLGVAFVFFLMYSVILIALNIFLPSKYISLSPYSFAGLLLLILSVSAFVMLICSFSDSGFLSTLIIFLATAFMAYAGGRIIPSIYLPELVERIGNYLPIHYWAKLTESIVSGKVALEPIFVSFAMFVVLYIAGSVITVVRGGSRR